MIRFAWRITTLATAALLATAGCDLEPTGPRTEHAQLGLTFATMVPHPLIEDGSQSFTHACPGGGEIIWEGTTTTATEDDDMVLTWERTTTYDNCTIPVNNTTAISDGQMEHTGSARFSSTGSNTATLKAQQSTQVGTLTTVFNGRSRTCEYDLATEFQADDDTYRITGLACGRNVDMRVLAQH